MKIRKEKKVFISLRIERPRFIRLQIAPAWALWLYGYNIVRRQSFMLGAEVKPILPTWKYAQMLLSCTHLHTFPH